MNAVSYINCEFIDYTCNEDKKRQHKKLKTTL